MPVNKGRPQVAQEMQQKEINSCCSVVRFNSLRCNQQLCVTGAGICTLKQEHPRTVTEANGIDYPFLSLSIGAPILS